jgi:HAD superfamily hydrolase (TIGR01484 family)
LAVKKVLAFDLDNTLAPSKSVMTDQMNELFSRLLEEFQVCVISGGKFEQFQKQILNGLRARPAQLERLHLMPTCGTRYYTYERADYSWRQIYAEDFSLAEKQKITAALEAAARQLGYDKVKTYGRQIEDRGSQISWSGFGQDVVDVLGEQGIKLKEDWDPDGRKKTAIQKLVAPRLRGFEVRAGGGTTIDVTKQGIDKAYGMKKLMEQLEIGKSDILFFGDKLQEGGNDYPVKDFGIDCLEVSCWQDTALALDAISAALA